MAWIRRIALGSAVCAAMTVLPGCGVPSAGRTGVSVTEDGQPLGVMLICHDHVDVALMYSDSDRAGEGSQALGRWTRTRSALTGYSTWPLSGAGEDGWSARKPMAPLAPGRDYKLYGSTYDNSWSAGSVSFSTEDLAALSPGQVRYLAGRVKGADADGQMTTSLAKFRATECAHPVAGRQAYHGTGRPAVLTRR
ncbi:hypothetical protein ACIQNU_07540 [Streptomyces sp. NPDC091292]|uniref:hypothetical protein n=1 Tax=Streptomyces sp. NPDC091292 TaxID=3365991 RepID=UPI003824884B